MTTISVPLPADLEKSLNRLVRSGYGSNQADVVRRAIVRLAEDEAVEAVLRAEREPSLSGNLKELAKKFE
jgi:Arc/MetJ-type ribon-helix-helix transcriptional regulator